MTPTPVPYAALVLAAGQGKRMASRLPKILHPCHEVPLVCHPVARAAACGCRPVVVVASPDHRAAVQETLALRLPEVPCQVTVQPRAAGTGDAARCGLEALGAFEGRVLVLYGDTPLLTERTLSALMAASDGVAVAFLTAVVDDPSGYGRVVRDAAGAGAAIVEDRDASASQRQIREINAGVYAMSAALLRLLVARLNTRNAQGELYLTDCVALAAGHGGARPVPVDDLDEIRGVNDRAQLQVAEAIWRRRTLAGHQARGVSFHDPAGTVVGPEVQIAGDCDIGQGVQILGRSRLGEGVRVEGPAVVIDSTLSAGSTVRAFCHLEGAEVGDGATVGPLARLRPGAQLGAASHVGNFVEVKNARLGVGAKANHLSYVGDATVGDGANLGAGTITCNYDGVAKHRTQIGRRAFVGSHATLVAPVAVGDDALVAAGSTITQDVPDGAMALGRAHQVIKPGRATALRARLVAAKNSKG